ncbi:peptidoglycan-binding protein [Bradyrhizobium lablabi]|uniref:peptidoglycan-binding domain-containing protein n=1 Tax=Bradyrhizobium lablabi TaxID=722472 RepID=UPI001BA5DDA9|nr:peptidoglycan-binding protein [Bradyrhizobium lablabi]MBR0692054.1 peptidoglycan-binding protein [Bradyrhizobium lablabi]
MVVPVVTKPRLASKLFRDNEKLQKCLKIPSEHVIPGSRGEHVSLIQKALMSLGVAVISPGEIASGNFGPSTLKAVRAFKGPPRNIINRTYQNTPDDIVGQMTIERLDNEMDILENESPASSALVAFDDFGPPHDHTRCPPPSSDAEIELSPDGTMSHVGTPMNPLGIGRKINIGGIKEAIGFEDCMPDPALDPDMLGVPLKGRRLTSSIPKHTVSDICVRSAPIDRFMKREIKRICMRGARLTVVQSVMQILASDFPYFREIGVIIEQGFVPSPFSPADQRAGKPREIDRPFVVVTILNVNPDNVDPF